MIKQKTGDPIPDGARMTVQDGDETTIYFETDPEYIKINMKELRHVKEFELINNTKAQLKKTYASSIGGKAMEFSTDYYDIQDLIAASHVIGGANYKAIAAGDVVPVFKKFSQADIKKILSDYYLSKENIISKRDQLVDQVNQSAKADIEGIKWS